MLLFYYGDCGKSHSHWYLRARAKFHSGQFLGWCWWGEGQPLRLSKVTKCPCLKPPNLTKCPFSGCWRKWRGPCTGNIAMSTFLKVLSGNFTIVSMKSKSRVYIWIFCRWQCWWWHGCMTISLQGSVGKPFGKWDPFEEARKVQKENCVHQ